MKPRPTKLCAIIIAACATIVSSCTGGGGGGGAAPLQIVSDALPTFILNQNVSAALVTSGGVPPISWSITEGMLPVGVSLGTTTGMVVGTPSDEGSPTVIVTATDSRGATDTRFLPVLLQSDDTPQISGDPLEEGSTVSFYSVPTGGKASLWGLTSSALSRTRTSWAELADSLPTFGLNGSYLISGQGPVTVRETRHGATVAVLDSRTDLSSVGSWFSPDGAYVALALKGSAGNPELRVYRTANWGLVRAIADVGYQYVWAPTSDRLVGSDPSSGPISGPTRIFGAVSAALDRTVSPAGYTSCLRVVAWLKTDRLVRSCSPDGTPTRWNLITARAADDGDVRAVLTCDIDTAAHSCRRAGLFSFGGFAAGSPSGNRITVGVSASTPPATFFQDTVVAVEDVNGASPTVLVTPTPGQNVIVGGWR